MSLRYNCVRKPVQNMFIRVLMVGSNDKTDFLNFLKKNPVKVPRTYNITYYKDFEFIDVNEDSLPPSNYINNTNIILYFFDWNNKKESLCKCKNYFKLLKETNSKFLLVGLNNEFSEDEIGSRFTDYLFKYCDMTMFTDMDSDVSDILKEMRMLLH